MPTATAHELDALYRNNADPWNFLTSAYEREKYQRTMASLPRGHYRYALEVGCSIAVLGRMIAARCDHYLGVDASRRALSHAERHARPNMRFREYWLPNQFPQGDFDLVVLSEILYFLCPQDVTRLARQVSIAAPAGDILCVNMLGATDRELDGTTAVGIFGAALNRPQVCTRMAGGYRIDVFAGHGEHVRD